MVNSGHTWRRDLGEPLKFALMTRVPPNPDTAEKSAATPVLADLAKAAGVSPDTIRHHRKIGDLPRCPRAETPPRSAWNLCFAPYVVSTLECLSRSRCDNASVWNLC